MPEVEPRERMKVTSGLTYKEKLGDECGSLYITVNSDRLGFCEVFVVKGKSGGCINSLLEAVGRLISLSLASGISPRHVINQLKGIRCPHATSAPNGSLYSCPDAIAKTLDRYVNRVVPASLKLEEFEEQSELKQLKVDTAREPKKLESVIKTGENPECPQCGNMTQMEGRCQTCHVCGWSKCP
jgi:ribonucleoside-diphosphate reductase alpha chain